MIFCNDGLYCYLPENPCGTEVCRLCSNTDCTDEERNHQVETCDRGWFCGENPCA